MRTGATYRPAVNPNPLMSIDMKTGAVRRYIRVVLVAGLRQGVVMTHQWDAKPEGHKEFDRYAVEFDVKMLHQLRLTGETWEE